MQKLARLNVPQYRAIAAMIVTAAGMQATDDPFLDLAWLAFMAVGGWLDRRFGPLIARNMEAAFRRWGIQLETGE